jgi:light-regulated signal transduction histidine kinase (bacteriophytochrome)
MIRALQVSRNISTDFPDLDLPSSSLAGLLYIPLTEGARDFLAFVRRESVSCVRWATFAPTGGSCGGRPQLVVRTEVSQGGAAPWEAEQLKVASVLALVSGKVGSKAATM